MCRSLSPIPTTASAAVRDRSFSSLASSSVLLCLKIRSSNSFRAFFLSATSDTVNISPPLAGLPFRVVLEPALTPGSDRASAVKGVTHRRSMVGLRLRLLRGSRTHRSSSCRRPQANCQCFLPQVWVESHSLAWCLLASLGTPN
ncbi:hypothetical protein KC335_g147 [Hortaea werneckii]|nr:hypothetical protein KC335_g147 [Hortaea werneckii]